MNADTPQLVSGLGWPAPTTSPEGTRQGLAVGWPTGCVVRAGAGAEPALGLTGADAEPESGSTPPDHAPSEQAPRGQAPSQEHSLEPSLEPAGDVVPQPGTPSATVSRETPTTVRVARSLAVPASGPDTPLAAAIGDQVRRRIDLLGRELPPPTRTRVISVANQKGGVGKTTTVVNLAAALAGGGLDVLVLDLDPQGNASTALSVAHGSGTPDMYQVLVEGRPLDDVVVDSPSVPGLRCAPATIDLAGAEIELIELPDRERRLAVALTRYLDTHHVDYIFVDCPPSLGLLTVNALVAGAEVLIPIQCEYYALEGLSALLGTVDRIRAHLNPGLEVSTILLTMFDGRTRLAAQVAQEVRDHFPAQVLATTIPRSVRVSEAPSYGETVMTYDPGCSGALSYLEAAGDLAHRGATTTIPVAS